jgi:hypothetical protein
MEITAVEAAIKGCGKTIKAISMDMHVGQSTISTWLMRGKIPLEMMGKLVQAVGSPKLIMDWVASLEGNMFPTPYLDQVDDHPIIAIDRVIDEVKEFLITAESAKQVLYNRRRGHRFTVEDDALIKQFENETADLITGAKTILIRHQEWFNRPVAATMRRHIEKLESQGYCTKRKCSPMRAAK